MLRLFCPPVQSDPGERDPGREIYEVPEDPNAEPVLVATVEYAEDAPLFVASPELLRLAETLVEYLTAACNPEGATNDLLVLAQAAIHKATEKGV